MTIDKNVMTVDEALDKLNKIKESNKDGGSLRIYFPDLLPLRKIITRNVNYSNKFVLVTDK